MNTLKEAKVHKDWVVSLQILLPLGGFPEHTSLAWYGVSISVGRVTLCGRAISCGCEGKRFKEIYC